VSEQALVCEVYLDFVISLEESCAEYQWRGSDEYEAIDGKSI
jgi:hypothetical protein